MKEKERGKNETEKKGVKKKVPMRESNALNQLETEGSCSN